MFCFTLLYVHSSIAIILMGKRELVALLNLSSWCLVMVERLFLAVLWGCLRFVMVVFPDHTHLLFCMGQLRYICIHILTQCRSTSHCKDVQSHFLDVNVYKWMLSSTPVEVEVEVETQTSLLRYKDKLEY